VCHSGLVSVVLMQIAVLLLVVVSFRSSNHSSSRGRVSGGLVMVSVLVAVAMEALLVVAVVVSMAVAVVGLLVVVEVASTAVTVGVLVVLSVAGGNSHSNSGGSIICGGRGSVGSSSSRFGSGNSSGNVSC